MSVLTLTLNPSLDVTTSVDEVRSTDKLRCTAPVTDPGGGGINVARVISRLGGTATALFVTGGPNGRTLEERVAAEGITAKPVRIGGATRQSLTVVEHSTRDQYRFVLPGPELGASECQDCLDHVRASLVDVDYLVASGSLPPGVPTDFYAQIARLAAGHGIRFILDTSGEALEATLREPVFLIKPNARELRALAGDATLDEDGLIAFARELVSGGRCEIVALSLGEKGAVLIDRQQVHSATSPSIVTESAVGAGDSFVGALTLALARRHDRHAALCFGVAAGTAALLTAGTELCRREDVERLYQELMTR